MDHINDEPTAFYFMKKGFQPSMVGHFRKTAFVLLRTSGHDGLKFSLQMAKAGFIHVPSENSPDIAQCFFCLKELEGWEPEDDPEKEHKAHSPSCNFITLKKSVESLTVEEFLRLQKERQKCIIKKMCGQAIDKFEEAVKLKRGQIIQSAMGEE